MGLGIAKFPAIQAYLKHGKPAGEENVDMLEIIGLAVNQLEAEGRGVTPKKDDETRGFLKTPWDTTG